MPADEPSRAGYERISTGLDRLQRLLSSRRVSSSLAQAAGAPVGRQAMQLLRALRDGRPRPVAEAARSARLDVGAASRQLRALDEMGLTARSASPDNASVVLVRLSDEGLAVAQRLQQVNAEHLLRALDDWTDAERETLGALLLRLVDDLQRTPHPPAAGPETGRGRVRAT